MRGPGAHPRVTYNILEVWTVNSKSYFIQWLNLLNRQNNEQGFAWYAVLGFVVVTKPKDFIYPLIIPRPYATLDLSAGPMMITGTPRLARWCVRGRPTTSLFPAHANSFPFVLDISVLQSRPATRSQALAVHSLYIVRRKSATLFVVHSCSRLRRSATVQQTVVPTADLRPKKHIFALWSGKGLFPSPH